MSIGEHPILSVRNLRTAFFTEKETIRAVDGIWFDVQPGETVGIVGESGSGKSVTARSIMRLIKRPGRILDGSSIRFHDVDTVRAFARRFPDRTVDLTAVEAPVDAASSGQLSDIADVPPWHEGQRNGRGRPEHAVAVGAEERVDFLDADDCVFVTAGDPREPATIEEGFVDIARLDGDAAKAMRGGRVAMIFQDPQTSLNPVYTVGNQIVEALELHQDLHGQAAREEAIDLLESVGISDARRRIREYPHQFSGGMRQRAMIAMALACEPEVLICDEPTTALDVTIQAQILDLLDTLQVERDLAVIFITHDMGVIAQVCDRVNVMYAGEIIETGTVDDIFDRPSHPYTVGLMDSIPGAQAGDRLRTIPGNVPTPNEPATYCRFAPRCPEKFDACERIHPALVPVDEENADHVAACLLFPEDDPRELALAKHRGIEPPSREEDSS